MFLFLGDSQHDCGERCVGSLSRCSQLHANRQLGTEKAGVSLLDELRQITARHGDYGSQHICQGKIGMSAFSSSFGNSLYFLYES